MSIQDLTASLDLKQNLNIYATCKQLDNLNLILNIYDNSVQANLNNYTVRLKAMKADNVPLIQEHTGITILNNVVTIVVNEQLTTTSGKTLIELQFINTSTGQRKATFNLALMVNPSVLEVNATISTATYTLLQELENKLDQATDYFENVEDFQQAHPDLLDLNERVTQNTAQLSENMQQINKLTTETVAKTIYVSVNTGSDTTGNGSSAMPYKTLTKALSTLNKNINADILIRVLAGNYLGEGLVKVNNFRGTKLTITAFDGTNDVLVPSDNYIFDRIVLYDSEAIYIQGIKCNPSAISYGIYSSNSRFVRIIGYKIDSAIGSSGLGCTGNSFVWVSDSIAKNQATVISANQGATVVSQNWDTTNSINNSQGLVVDAGAKIHKYDDNQPIATVSPYIQKDGGVIFNKDGNPIRKNVSQQVFVQRDVTLTGNFDITISLPQSPTWIKVSACLTNTQSASEGQWAENGVQFCIYSLASGLKNGAYKLVTLTDTGANVVNYAVSSVSKTAITLTSTFTGTLTGTVYLSVLCGI